MAGFGSGSTEFRMLRSFSASIGADPLLVQGAGGNTSIKQDGVLWIKASGTWLMNALTGDIMVPVALEPLLDALAHRSDAAEKAGQFTLEELNPRRLRPSIETTVHALMRQKIVVHVHCVETISIAVQANAETLLEERLRGLDWAYVPYRRPGLPLAQAIAERLKPATNVLVLGNHGLVVAADTVAEAALLLQRVTGAISRVGGNILSSQVDLQAPQSRPGFIGVTASAELDGASLQPLLYDIEAGMPFLFVDQLVVQAPTGAGSGQGGKMRVLISVSGQWQRAK